MDLWTEPIACFSKGLAWRQRPFLSHLLLALFFLFFTLGCSLINRDDAPAEAPPDQETSAQVTLICSDECARRGQCGQAADGRTVILGHPDQPAVRDHQMVFTAETAVPQLNSTNKIVQVLSSGEQFEQPFYQVTRPEDGRSGWVAGWCVQP